MTGTRAAKWRDVAARLYGQRAYGWGKDEPNGATGYRLRVDAADFADDLLEALDEAGWRIFPPIEAGRFVE